MSNWSNASQIYTALYCMEMTKQAEIRKALRQAQQVPPAPLPPLKSEELFDIMRLAPLAWLLGGMVLAAWIF